MDALLRALGLSSDPLVSPIPPISPIPLSRDQSYQAMVRNQHIQSTPIPTPTTNSGSTPYMQTMAPQYKKLIQSYVPPQSQEDAANILHKAYQQGVQSPEALAYTLATVNHETGGQFKPIKEYGAASQAAKYGYQGGANYAGRGYIQLTGLPNYAKYGQELGLDLVNHPEMANDPEVAAKLTAAYMADQTPQLQQNLQHGNYRAARQQINGPGALGLVPVTQKYKQYISAIQRANTQY